MTTSGQARVPTLEQQQDLFEAIKEHRHPEKNTTIMQISFKLGLRVQEIALLKGGLYIFLNNSSNSIAAQCFWGV